MDIIYNMQREMFRRKYSLRTISTYLRCVKEFINKNHKEFRKYSRKDVEGYLCEMAERNVSGSTINIHLNAIKFMMSEILHKYYYYRIKYSKNENKKRFPEALTKDEVKKLFSAIENEKHKLMIEFMYSSGLRVSELINLKTIDMNIAEGYGYVRRGKGNKDRLFVIADCLKEELKKLSFGEYVFSGANGQYSVRTIQEILRKVSERAGIKHVHPHMLRHSFATHLIENGYSVSQIQSLLGHASPETSMVYVHMASCKMIDVKSPLDAL